MGTAALLLASVVSQAQHLQLTDNSYVLPMYTQNISTLEIIHPVGALDILGTQNPSAYIVFRRLDERAFTESRFMPRIEKVSPTTLRIAPPAGKKYYVSPLIMQIFLPRMQNIVVRGESLRFKIVDIQQLKNLSVHAKRADLDLHQSRLRFEVKVHSGNIMLTSCQECQGVLKHSKGNLYMKGCSGEYQVVGGNNLRILSNEVSGIQEYRLKNGEVQMVDGQGQVRFLGKQPQSVQTLQGKIHFLLK